MHRQAILTGILAGVATYGVIHLVLLRAVDAAYQRPSVWARPLQPDLAVAVVPQSVAFDVDDLKSMEWVETSTVEQWLGLRAGVIAEATPDAKILDFSRAGELDMCEKVVAIPYDDRPSYLVIGILGGKVRERFAYRPQWICSEPCVALKLPTAAD